MRRLTPSDIFSRLLRRALLHSYLLCAVSRLPAITKAFSLAVPARLGANRKVVALFNNPYPRSSPPRHTSHLPTPTHISKVALSNPYSYDANFLLSTDRPERLGFKQRAIAVPAGEMRYIGLKFAATEAPAPRVEKLLVFVNNADDKNEECMEIAVEYSADGA